MALAFVQGNGFAASATGTTITTTLTSVGAGNLIVLFTKIEGATATITASDGTNSFTQSPQGITAHANNDVRGVFLYLLSSSSGSKTYTVTFGASRTYRTIVVLEFSKDAAETLSIDGYAGGSGTSAVVSSGSIITTGSDVMVIGGYGEYSSTTTTAELVDGTAADGSQDSGSGFTSAWWRAITAPISGAATGTLSGSLAWISQGIAFKSAVAAGAAFPASQNIQQAVNRSNTY